MADFTDFPFNPKQFIEDLYARYAILSSVKSILQIFIMSRKCLSALSRGIIGVLESDFDLRARDVGY